MKTANTFNWLVGLFGVWTAVAPFILDYANVQPALWNGVLVGIFLIVLAVWAALTDSVVMERNLSWTNAALGLWLALAPFILGYGSLEVATWNTVVTGIIVLVVSIWAALRLSGPVVD